MDSFDSFLMTMYVIAIVSGVIFILGLIAEIAWPWIANRSRRPQATYRTK